MQVRGFNNVGRAAQTDPKLLRLASTITKQKKCWEMLAQKFDRFEFCARATTCNKAYKRTQHVSSNNLMLAKKVASAVARGFTWQKRRKTGITGLA